jgi:hypothetical protein
MRPRNRSARSVDGAMRSRSAASRSSSSAGSPPPGGSSCAFIDIREHRADAPIHKWPLFTTTCALTASARIDHDLQKVFTTVLRCEN